MKNKRLLTAFLALAMLISLCACGTGAAPETSEAPAAEESAQPAAPESAAPEETPEEAPAPEEAAPPASTIEYPLEESYTFTMTTIARNNVLPVIGDGDFTITPVYKAFAEATGCEIDFNMMGEATASEKINILLASGDMTDFFCDVGTYSSNLPSAITDGILINLADYMDEFMPDYKAMLDADPDLHANAYNYDGSICKFVSKEAGLTTKGIVIRQDWLDKLGLEAPTNREDLEVVLKQFKSECGATMPLLVNEGLETGLSGSFNVAYAGMRGITYQLTEPNGAEVVANLASENFIEYLLYMNHLYEEGLIIDDFMSTGREYGNWESSYYNGLSGVWSDGYRELDPANRKNAADPNYTTAGIAMSDYEGHVSEASTVTGNGMVFLTTACEKPELAMQLMNFCYTPEGMNINSYGVLDESYIINDAGEVEFTEAVTNNPDGMTMTHALLWYSASQWLPTVVTEHYYELVCSPEAMESIALWSEADGDASMRLPAAVILNSEDSDEYFKLSNDVVTLFSEAATKVVIGDLDEAGYRKIIEDAQGIGLTRMTELYQNAYDKYLAEK